MQKRSFCNPGKIQGWIFPGDVRRRGAPLVPAAGRDDLHLGCKGKGGSRNEVSSEGGGA